MKMSVPPIDPSMGHFSFSTLTWEWLQSAISVQFGGENGAPG